MYREYNKNMKVIVVAAIITATLAANIHLTLQPNQECQWQDSGDCPLYSFGNQPVCDHTPAYQLDQNLYGMKICTAEMFFMGNSYDVRLTVPGVIESVHVMSPENNNNCDSGQMSVGSRVFYAYCKGSGPSRISGYWAITYRMDGSVETQ